MVDLKEDSRSNFGLIHQLYKCLRKEVESVELNEDNNQNIKETNNMLDEIEFFHQQISEHLDRTHNIKTQKRDSYIEMNGDGLMKGIDQKVSSVIKG